MPTAGLGGVAPSRKAATNLTKIPKLLKATYITEGETLLYERRPTRWIYLPAPTIFLILVAVIDVILLHWAYPSDGLLGFIPGEPSFLSNALGSANASVLLIIAVVLILIGVLFFAVRWYRYARTVYVLTSTRVIRQKGILAKDFDEVQLAQVRGVDVKQHVLQRILNYGTIRISAEFGGLAPNAMGNEEWPGVVRAMEFARTIETAQEQVKRAAGTPTPAAATPPLH